MHLAGCHAIRGLVLVGKVVARAVSRRGALMIGLIIRSRAKPGLAVDPRAPSLFSASWGATGAAAAGACRWRA